MFILQLNDMRSSNIENLCPVARAETAQELERFMEDEIVEAYRDGGWGKQYREGGPLEWYNPPYSFDQNIVDVGSADEWAANARREFEERIMAIPVAV